MKKLTILSLLLGIIGAFLAFKPSTSEDECDYSKSLKKYYSNWGERCAKCGDLYQKSYTVRYRNEGTEKLDIKIALQKENKTWDSFSFQGVAPNDTFQVCVCNGTSKVLKWAIKSGDKTCVLPTEREIQNL